MAETLLLLAIETNLRRDRAAVLEGPRPPRAGVPGIRSNVVASQIDLHERFGGVVPEIAARAHVRQILPVIDEALRRAGVSLGRTSGAVAVATRPGLVGALVIGLTAAKSLALALGIPLVAVDHLEGHLYACQLRLPRSGRSIRASGWSVSGGPHQPLRVPGADRGDPAGRHDRRRGGRRPSTRSPASWAWAIPAAPASSAPRAGGTLRPMPSRVPSWVTTGSSSASRG